MSNTYTSLVANELCQILAEIARAKHRCELLMNQPYIINKSKQMLRTAILNRTNLIERDIRLILGDNEKEIMKKAIQDIEGSFQLAEIQTSFLMLDQENRAKVEEYIVSLAKEQAAANESKG